MAEKKRQYSRALAQKRCLEAIERAILINKSEAERPFVFQVQELVVFGSLVDTDAPTVHGVDILATTARHHRYRNRDEAFTVTARISSISTLRSVSVRGGSGKSSRKRIC